MVDHRVCFDFDITFLNGGGIQGQGFRLDIKGNDISDTDLAEHIISDLRLLMVKHVKILNKSIIREAHKRKPPVAYNGGDAEFVDLSHTIIDGMMTYKGLPAPLICDHISYMDSRKIYEEGTEFQIGKIEMVANTGTYLDTPYHRYSHGDDLETIALDKMSACDGIVINLRGYTDRAIDWVSLSGCNIHNKAVLIETGWSDKWGQEAYFEGHPYLTQAAATYLNDKGAKLVGIDSLNIDDTSAGTRPVHSTLLGAGIPIVEHLTNLNALPESGFKFWAVPPKIRKMGTFPVRAHARISRKKDSV